MNIFQTIIALILLLGFLFGVFLWSYGLFISFKTNIIGGIIVLFIEPAPVLVGALDFFFDYNLVEVIANR